MLPEVVVVSPIVSVVVPVTAAPMVKLSEVAVRLIALPAVLSTIVPEVVRLPVLLTEMPPPVSVIPVTPSVAAVFVNWMLPLVVLVALKLATVFAPFSVVPMAELVASVATVIAELCVMAPAVLVSDNVPVPLIGMATFSEPLWLTLRTPLSTTEPAASWVMLLALKVPLASVIVPVPAFRPVASMAIDPVAARGTGCRCPSSWCRGWCRRR